MVADDPLDCDMTDHAQLAHSIIDNWKLNGPDEYDAAMQYLELNIANALTQAHAAGRREGLEEAHKLGLDEMEKHPAPNDWMARLAARSIVTAITQAKEAGHE